MFGPFRANRDDPDSGASSTLSTSCGPAQYVTFFDADVIAARGCAPTEPVGRDSPGRTHHVDALWAALFGRCCYFLRTSFIPQHMSFAGAPPCQPTPATSMWSSSTRVSVAEC